jgi:hypothetical protein
MEPLQKDLSLLSVNVTSPSPSSTSAASDTESSILALKSNWKIRGEEPHSESFEDYFAHRKVFLTNIERLL